MHSFLKEEGPCPPLLDPLKDLRINTFEVVQKIKEADRLREKLKEAAPSMNPLFMKQVSISWLEDTFHVLMTKDNHISSTFVLSLSLLGKRLIYIRRRVS